MDKIRLRSNTFLTLLLRAGCTELSSHSEFGVRKNGITRSGLLVDMLKLSMPEYEPKRMDTLVSYFSKYIQGTPPHSPKYLPFTTISCREGLGERINNNYNSVLLEMDAICKKYLDNSDYKLRLLVAGIIDAILADESFDGEFDIGNKKIKKAELDKEDRVQLQPFLISVWNIILSAYPNTSDGAETYLLWTRDAGFNTPREIKTEIGVKRAKKITVSAELPKEVKADTVNKTQHYSQFSISKAKEKPTSSSMEVAHHQAIEQALSINLHMTDTEAAPAVNDVPNGLIAYMEALKNKYNRIPTILYKEALTPFKNYYVPNNLKWYERLPDKRNSYYVRIIEGGNVAKLLEVSHYVVLSGSGGLGKSMMMRRLLISAVEEYKQHELIPFFVPLKDYDLSYPGILDYVYSTASSLWPELTLESLAYILSQGKSLLLFDGLDEVHTSMISDFTKKMNTFQDRYSNNTFIISSRPYSNFHSFTRSTVMYLLPFTKSQAIDLVKRYNYRSDVPSLQERFLSQLDSELYDNHKGFSDNPLLLSIMMMTFEMDAEVPLVKYLFYQEAYTVLSRRHDAMKEGYSRKLATGWNANQFADYFAFFCATTYNDGKVSFTLTEIEQYFRMLKKKYGIKDVTTDDFIYDLINNLCLMYQDGLSYGFIHRSFQEYFCAKYFNAQLDELLVHVISVFDRDDRTKKVDTALEMLYDMKPKAVEKYLIIPYIKKLIEDCENKDGIWTFLGKLYYDYEMADGDACTDEDNCKPHSNLYEFILKHYNVELTIPSPEDYPDIYEFLQDQSVYREDTDEDDWKENLPYDYEDIYGEPTITGNLYVIDWHKARESQWHRQHYREFISAVEKQDNVFMKEYNTIKCLLKQLEDKYSSSPSPTVNLFDLME